MAINGTHPPPSLSVVSALIMIRYCGNVKELAWLHGLQRIGQCEVCLAVTATEAPTTIRRNCSIGRRLGTAPFPLSYPSLLKRAT